jgi:hypothetical protein
MSRNNHKEPNKKFFGQAVLDFSVQYGIDLKIFGDDELHWRLTGASATLDIWPTTGKYWVKDVPLGYQGLRNEKLPHDLDKLESFFRRLFNV